MEAVSLAADANETKGQWNPIGLTYTYSKASQIGFKSHMRGFHPRFKSYQQGWTVFGVNLGSLTNYLASHVEMLPSGSVYGMSVASRQRAQSIRQNLGCLEG